MAELKEVFEMVTKQTEPDMDSWKEQESRQRRASRNRKIGALALAAALVVGAGLVAANMIPQDERGTPGTRPSTVAPPDVPTATRPVVLDLLTGETTPLAENLAGSNFAASSDGSMLAHVKTGAEGTPQVFIAGIDGTGIRQVTHDPTGAVSPAWSPDGTSIAYVGYGSGDVQNLFVLEIATGETRQITDETRDLWGPSFTPDGSSLVYTDPVSASGAEMRTVLVAGGRSTILFGGGHGGMGHAGSGSISPDGSLVAMTGHEIVGPGAALFVSNADGTQRRAIPGYGTNPAGTWSPDGRRILALQYEEVGGGIIVVDIATGDALPVVAQGRDAVWLDDHTLLVETPPALEIATGFVEAYGAFDAERAVSYLADDADISALFSPGQPQDLRLLTSFLEAQGYNQTLGPCEALGSSASVTSFQCPFDFHAIRSAEIGLDLQLSVEERPPYSGSYFELIVRDGEIVRASVYLETAEFGPQLWEPFADWVSTNHPRDAAVMYNEDLTDFRLTEESIRLWERHTRGYVKELAGR